MHTRHWRNGGNYGLHRFGDRSDAKSIENGTCLGGIAILVTLLRQSLGESRQHLGDIVVNHYDREQHQKYKSDLIDALFDLKADVAPITVSTNSSRMTPPSRIGIGNRFKNSQIQADSGCQPQQWSPAFFLRRFARILCNSNGTGKGTDGNFVAALTSAPIEESAHRWYGYLQGSGQKPVPTASFTIFISGLF